MVETPGSSSTPPHTICPEPLSHLILPTWKHRPHRPGADLLTAWLSQLTVGTLTAEGAVLFISVSQELSPEPESKQPLQCQHFWSSRQSQAVSTFLHTLKNLQTRARVQAEAHTGWGQEVAPSWIPQCSVGTAWDSSPSY